MTAEKVEYRQHLGARSISVRFTVEFAAITGSAIKAASIKIFLDGEKVFWAVFEPGWEEDSDTKLLHWGSAPRLAL